MFVGFSNIQNIPTPILYLASLLGSPSPVILQTACALLTDNQTQTVPFGVTLPNVPSIVIIVILVPAGGTAFVVGGNVVRGSITATGFDVTLSGNPGDATHQICWIAIA